MHSHFYPDDWPAIARAIKAANHWQCQACNMQCRRPGEFWLGWQYELTLSHYDQEYDGEAIFVVPLCIRCHLLHDAPFVWSARRRADRQRQRVAGQLELQLPSTAGIQL